MGRPACFQNIAIQGSLKKWETEFPFYSLEENEANPVTPGTEELEKKLDMKEVGMLAHGQPEMGLSLALEVEIKGIMEAFRL